MFNRLTLMLIVLFVVSSSYGQELKPITKRIIVKSNILNLIAKLPAISVEKPLTNKFGLEVSAMAGQFPRIFSQVSYAGYLLRGKLYFPSLEVGRMNGYAGVYVGALWRQVDNEGWSSDNGLWGAPASVVSGNSIRSGGSLGLMYISNSRFVIDGQSSLGIGRYLHPAEAGSNGYLDVQIWLSLGYCF